MRDFFIRSLDILIGIFVVIAILGVFVFAGLALSGAGMVGPDGMPIQGGVVPAIGILIGGLIYICFVAGFMYLGLGIYHNTRRTAEAVERLAGQGQRAI